MDELIIAEALRQLYDSPLQCKYRIALCHLRRCLICLRNRRTVFRNVFAFVKSSYDAWPDNYKELTVVHELCKSKMYVMAREEKQGFVDHLKFFCENVTL
jgi:hypothetical protein